VDEQMELGMGPLEDEEQEVDTGRRKSWALVDIH